MNAPNDRLMPTPIFPDLTLTQYTDGIVIFDGQHLEVFLGDHDDVADFVQDGGDIKLITVGKGNDLSDDDVIGLALGMIAAVTPLSVSKAEGLYGALTAACAARTSRLH